MTDPNLDDVLRRAANSIPGPEPALLERISGSLGESISPVRPLPPARSLAFRLFLICAAIVIAGASLLGFGGVRQMNPAEVFVVFAVVTSILWLAGISAIRAFSPGSAGGPAWRASAISIVALIALFAAVFHNYGWNRFLAQGLICLVAGLVLAAVSGAAAAIALRRGFAVNPTAAGLAIGTLGGLAGAAMLELHCVDFHAPHLLVWHTAVVLVSAAVGAAAGAITERRRSR